MLSPASTPEFHALLEAASALLEARRCQMVTRVEWSDLERTEQAARRAVAAARSESFGIEGEHLVWAVRPEKGTPYRRRCSRPEFQAVLTAIAEQGATEFIISSLAARAGVSARAAGVAVAFLKGRGLLRRTPTGQHLAAAGFTIRGAGELLASLAQPG